MKKQSEKLIKEFLHHSNLIENVDNDDADIDARAAWDYAMSLKEMDVKGILQIHRILMARLNLRIAGKIRHCDVWIGGKKKKFITTYLIEQNLGMVCALMNHDTSGGLDLVVNRQTKKGKENLAQETHVMFEDIHFAEDGNGRTGRILYNWHRLKLGLPIHVIHAGEEQQNYYLWFKD
jgi:Fic family protein